MLLTTVALGLLLQSPQDTDRKPWVDQGFDPTLPNAYALASPPELSRKEARSRVQELLRENHADRVRAIAEAEVGDAAGVWLPGFVREKVVQDWTRDQLRRVTPKVVDEDVVVRHHGFGDSYQAYLLVDEVDASALRKRGGLDRRLAREEKRFLAKVGALGGLWAVLGLLVLWVDRLTRGYMTKRLYALGAAVALAGPVMLVVL